VDEDTNIPKVDVVDVVESVFAAMEESLSNGNDVSIQGFGIFKVKERAARMGRNPATGASIKIAAKKVVSFKPAKALKDTVAG